jgi:hypothetical protein
MQNLYLDIKYNIHKKAGLFHSNLTNMWKKHNYRTLGLICAAEFQHRNLLYGCQFAENTKPPILLENVYVYCEEQIFLAYNAEYSAPT